MNAGKRGEIPGKFPSKIQKGLLEVVIALGRDFIILKIILPVEGHLLWLHLPVLHINLVSTYHDGDAITHPIRAKRQQFSVI